MNRTLLFVGAFVIVLGGAGAFFLMGSDQSTAPLSSPAAQTAAVQPPNTQELLASARDAFLGDGVAQSDANGAALILQAADAGDQKAIGFAGTLYMGGIGVEQDITKARQWLSKSSDAEAQKLAEALLTFEAVLQTMPEHEAQMEKEMSSQQAQESIRASFMAAMQRQKMEEAQTLANAEAAAGAEGVDKLDGTDGAVMMTDEDTAPPADETTIPAGDNASDSDTAPADADAPITE